MQNNLLATLALGGIAWWALSKNKASGPSPDEDTGLFPCPYCDETFGSQDGLTAHLYHYHPQELPPTEPPPVDAHVCPYCGELFESLNDLQNHIYYDHPEPEEPAEPEDPRVITVFSNLRVIPQRITVGESLEVRVDATNIGSTPVNFELNLGPDTNLSTAISLEPGEQKTYTWHHTPTRAGHFEVIAGETTVMFEVTEYEDPYQPPVTDPDHTAMANHVPAGIVWTFAHTGPGTFEYGVAPEQAHWIKHSGNHYRTANLSNVIDYWVDSQGLHRQQLQGTSTAYPVHHTWEPGNMYWYNYQALFNYLDAGCPNGWLHEGIWNDARYNCVHGDGTNWMCEYFPGL
ncbi:MAG: C2H2-type zinc finger protein [Dehalococcoidaceae bacterium]|nr:C2H2-type zinc finger protein [Dehalococcoidaceae bacterium]